MTRKLFSVATAFVFACMAFLTNAAQDTTPKIINGGVLNGKATSLPKPMYPTEAREVRIEGTVAVDIVIDEGGNVISAEAEVNDQRIRRAEDGSALDPVPVDASLRAASEDAARRATFSPTLLNGEPVRVKGTVIYNFVAVTVPKMVTGGILNGKASSLPPPAYPPAAIAVRASGIVSVQVTVDEDGNVISAAAVSGHPLLRAAAEAAARNAKFTPTLLSGNPVKISGIITYNFVLPTKDDQ